MVNAKKNINKELIPAIRNPTKIHAITSTTKVIKIYKINCKQTTIQNLIVRNDNKNNGKIKEYSYHEILITRKRIQK